MVYSAQRIELIFTTEDPCMETVCTFSITPLDRALLPQVQTLLAKRV